ncbi:MAG: phosphotransferase [Proteobacteria bacterium]|nr:phosphotransferase [Pseudomonadota bacterium]MCP4921102.1 phosphotransferase [Pseudomonadota bacterium]
MIDPVAHVRERLPQLGASQAQVLTGGLLNHVWRVVGSGGSVVVKHAPPYVASAPDVPLDVARIGFEERALRMLGQGGVLQDVASPQVRPPRLLDRAGETLILEDLGDLPHLGERPSPEAAAALGRFIGRLHARSASVRGMANDGVQATRNALCYQRYDPALGVRLMQPGVCLVMGDLWPPSVLVDGWGARVIDWELAHFGQPMQDTAHLAAHLWLADALPAWAAFDRSYRDEVDPQALQPDHRSCFARHFGVELLVRALGPFPMPVREGTEAVGRAALLGQLPPGVAPA